MSPRVAIVTPTYQHAEFIEDCVRSVIAQTASDWEMVVVDDGSTDGTLDLVRRFNDPRIRLVQREHIGLAGLGSAYAAAVELTTAPLIAVLEGDDSWPTEKLALQLPLFDDTSVVLSYGEAALIDRRGRQYSTYKRHPAGRIGTNDPPGVIVGPLARNNFIVAATVIVRRVALHHAGGFWQPDGTPYVDHPTWLRLALEGRFAYCPSVVGRWRRHSEQYTTAFAATSSPDPTPYIRQTVDLAARRGLGRPDHDALVAAPVVDQRRRALRAISRALRLELLAGDWTAARGSSRRLICERATGESVALGLLGWISALVRMDMEWVFRATGRLSWPPRR